MTYEENPPSTGALVVGALVGAAVLAWVFWPKKAAATVPTATKACGTDTEIKSFIAAGGLYHVILVDNAPTTEVPPPGYDTLVERIYNRTDCSFYHWLSENNQPFKWQKAEEINAQFAAWKAIK